MSMKKSWATIAAAILAFGMVSGAATTAFATDAPPEAPTTAQSTEHTTESATTPEAQPAAPEAVAPEAAAPEAAAPEAAAPEAVAPEAAAPEAQTATTTPTAEVGLYLYKKKTATAAPSWENSGTQTLLATQTGTDWFTTLPKALPAEVCGDGWAYQQDKVKDWGYAGAYKWPTTITYPTDNLPSKYDALHGELSALTTVPACAPPAPKAEVAIYIYKKLVESTPAGWSNSGLQKLCDTAEGTDWFTSVPATCVPPTEVCGTGWAYQQDKVKDWNYAGRYTWPATITYPDGSGTPFLYDSKHGELSSIVTVPPCAPVVPPQPQPKSGADTANSVDCALTLTTVSTPWTQGWVLDAPTNTWVEGPKVTGTATTTTRTTDLTEVATLGLTVPTDCAVVPPVTPPTQPPVAPPVVPPVIQPPVTEPPVVTTTSTETVIKPPRVTEPETTISSTDTPKSLASTGIDQDQTIAIMIAASVLLLGGAGLTASSVIGQRREARETR